MFSIIRTPTGFKLSSKGKVVNSVEKMVELVNGMSYSTARKLRRALAEFTEGDKHPLRKWTLIERTKSPVAA